MRTAVDLAGPDLRAGSLERVLLSETVRSGIYPELPLPEDRHDVRQSHVVRADCEQRRFVSGPDDLFLTGPR